MMATMATPPRRIDFFFDFASPYAYFSLTRLEELAIRHNCEIRWRPILLWAARKHFAMTPPMQDGAKATYMMADIERSAAFFGVPFRMPDSFGKSSHLAARLFYGLTGSDRQMSYAKAVFTAHFAQNKDIGDTETLAGIAECVGISRTEVEVLSTAQASKDALVETTEEAIRNNVWGSPYFLIDGEGFFGADRLPQLDWRLAGGAGQGGTLA